jgi:hypothetical protein
VLSAQLAALKAEFRTLYHDTVAPLEAAGVGAHLHAQALDEQRRAVCYEQQVRSQFKGEMDLPGHYSRSRSHLRLTPFLTLEDLPNQPLESIPLK